jgi:acyl-CoA reductase-like NAD-dependent aldehyde dehydrogenase
MQNSIIVGVVEEANRLPFGLVSYTCTCSDRNRDRPGKVKAGMISINSFAWPAAPSPFVFLIRSSLAAASSHSSFETGASNHALRIQRT